MVMMERQTVVEEKGTRGVGVDSVVVVVDGFRVCTGD